MAEAERNILHRPSGYKEDFVNEVNKYLYCKICEKPSKEPILTRCGHRFCKECIDDYLQRLVN